MAGQVGPELSQCTSWPEREAAQVRQYQPDVAALLVGRWDIGDRMHDGKWMHIGEPDFDRHLISELEREVNVLGSGGATVALWRC